MCAIPLKLMKMIIQQKMGKTCKTAGNINKYPPVSLQSNTH